MSLSWNQIRVRAAEFSKEWNGAEYEKGEAQSFYNDFFEIFGIRRRTVARFEEHVRKLDNRSGFIDLYWPGVLIAEHKSLGRDLSEAADQAGEYFDALDEADKPRFQLVCDFQAFQLLDRERGELVDFSLVDLPDYVEHFSFILGKQKLSRGPKEPVNIAAAQIVAKLYDGLQSAGYCGENLERFLVRTVFCFFADNTGIFEPRGLFLDFIESRTQEDGSDIGALLTALFQVLNTPYDRRQTTLDADLAQFAYINGDLFADALPIPSFSQDMRAHLLEAASFDWASISPAIFGSLFQSVLSNKERRNLGGYFTSESDILKLISDLFLSDLYEDLRTALTLRTGKAHALQALRQNLANFSWLDPACGCGNFLAVAYREIRVLELEIVKALADLRVIDFETDPVSLIDVDQFYGIESREYSARIAETALWMTDHISNNHLSLELGVLYSRVPLVKSPTILVADALEVDWHSIREGETMSYVLGNPPYRGSKKQTAGQRRQINRLSQSEGNSTTLDYVSGWIFKGAPLVRRGAKLGYVTTNSIVQGEQIAQIWTNVLHENAIELFFAHQPFDWRTEAAGDAAVHVVIFGLRPTVNGSTKKLYKYPTYDSDPSETRVSSISPYLISADNLHYPNTVVVSERLPINGMPRTTIGSKPVDGGYFVLNTDEKEALLDANPEASAYVRPYVGTTEWLTGEPRYILYLEHIPPSELRRLRSVKEMVQKVRQWRNCDIPNKAGNSFRKKSDGLVDTPTKYHVTRVPDAPYLIIPEVTSERREYVPIGWLEPPTIPSNLVKIVLGASLVHFALLTSAMHMAWLSYIGGRLESRASGIFASVV